MADTITLKCDRCGYQTTTKGNLVRHLQSKKTCPPKEKNVHRNIQLETLTDKDMTTSIHVCKTCGSRYKHASSLSKHKKQCKKESSSSNEVTQPMTSLGNNPLQNKDLQLTATNTNLTQEDNNEEISRQSYHVHSDMFDQVTMFKTLCIHLQTQMSQLQKELADVKSASSIQTTQPEHPHKIGYIYLIREREFVNSNQNVFKVGRTIQKTPTCYLERLKDYKRGSQMLSVIHVDCDDCEHIESKVKDVFNKMFKRHNDGHEYFEGDPKTMSMVINAIYADYYCTLKPIT